MFGFIKFIFKTVIASLLILIGIIVAAFILVNPNNYKDKISVFVENNTGYKLEINGLIQLSFTKKISLVSLEVQNIKINNKSQDKISDNVLDVKKLAILVDPLKSLLNKKIIISKFEFEDLEIYIFKNAYKLMLEGEANIDVITKNIEILSSKIGYGGIEYNLIGNVNYKDNKFFGDTQLQLLTNNIQYNKDKIKIDNIFLDTKFALDAKQIDLNHILLKQSPGEISGNIKISILENQGEFDLKIKNIEAVKLIDTIIFIQDHKETKLPNTSEQSNIVTFFKKLRLTGLVRGDSLLISPNLSIGNIDFHLENKEPSIFEINKGFFNLAKADVHLDFKADINKESKIELNLKTKDIDMSSINKIFSSGRGIIDIKLSTTADSYTNLLNNLTGNIDLVVANGTLRGIDFYDALNKSEECLNDLFTALLKDPKQDLNVLLSNSKKTFDNLIEKDAISDFSVFKLQALLKNGVDTKSSIVLKHQKYSMQGSGVIDLAKNHLNYQFRSQLAATPSQLTKEITQYMQIVPLTTNVEGSLTNIVFSADIKNYLLTALKELQKIALQNKELNVVSGQMEDPSKDSSVKGNQSINNPQIPQATNDHPMPST